MRVAFVVQRYGLEVNGGAEMLCRLLAEHMSKYWNVEVITTCAVDYVTWKNGYRAGIDNVNGIKVRRFLVDSPRKQWWFGFLSKIVFSMPHPKTAELMWMKAQGPSCTGLQNFIEKEKDNYDCFIFFTYLYCTTFFGLSLVRGKAILVPTAEDAPPLYLDIFKDIFNMPRAIIYNTDEEKKLVNNIFKNEHISDDIVGVGIDIPEEMNAQRFRKKFNLQDDFVLYVGRITVDKGCYDMFDYFIRYKKERPSRLKLVLIGKAFMKIPEHPDIINLGFVSDEDKFDSLRASKLLIMPSPYESLSMVILEAWFLSKAVLVNGRCEVLKGQCQRSNGGLCYHNYNEFENAMDYMLQNSSKLEEFGRQGNAYVEANYRWEIIEKKYIDLIEKAAK